MASPPAHSRVSGNPGATVRSPGSPLSRGRTEGIISRLEDGIFLTTSRLRLLTTSSVYARPYAASLIEGVVRTHPEGGARRGVLRRRLVTACPGRLGTPPARHYDLAARSSLCPIRCPPKRQQRRVPVREARPRGPKPPRWKRREASVPRYGTQGASLGAWRAAAKARSRASSTHEGAPHGCLARTRTFLGAPPTPRLGVSEAKSQTPGAKMRRGNE